MLLSNLIFEGPGAFDVDGRDLLTNEGRDIWNLNHCEVLKTAWMVRYKGLQHNFVSWCKFTLKPAISGGSGGSADHRFSYLVGSGNY
jgi:pectate lyase